MRTTTVLTALALTVVTALAGCSGKDQQENAGKQAAESAPAQSSAKNNYAAEQLAKYADVTLKADLSGLSANQKKMIGLLIDASDIMNDLYWRQAFGDRDDLLSSIKDPATRQFAEINYGPWDRLNDFKPFVEGFGKRPPGANFYPQDMTKDEFHKADLDGKTGLYTLLRRDADGSLMVVPYHEAYKDDLKRAADLLRQASKLADDKEFGHYLAMRADALVSDDYQPSDFAWMDMKNNPIDIVIGPIETYEDQLFGYKASYEAYVLLKDQEWSKKLSHFIQYLPELQKGLPVPDAYKAETPGTDSDLNAYNVLYYAGNANAGAKTIAINLPNDEEVQLKKGTRRLQLENAMRAKFDKIMVPIADEL
ncbi:MAG: Zn-dependent hydrolase, partial [Gammaproteobacteria bacterium]